MLSKIKVYNRKSGQIQDTFLLNYCGNEITLQVNDITGSRFNLTKTDPLNKFKKEIEGWWFCEEYVVIEIERDIKLTNSSIGNETYNGKYKNILFDLSAHKSYITNNNYKRWLSVNDKEYYRHSFGYQDVQWSGKNIDGDDIHYRTFPLNAMFQFLCDLELINKASVLCMYEKYMNSGKWEKENRELRITYSIGEDKYLKLLELINQ
jgi:hypothetical protein